MVVFDSSDYSIIVSMLCYINSSVNSVYKENQIFITEKLRIWHEVEQKNRGRVQAARISISPSEEDDEHITWIDAFLDQ